MECVKKGGRAHHCAGILEHIADAPLVCSSDRHGNMWLDCEEYGMHTPIGCCPFCGTCSCEVLSKNKK